MEYNPFLPFRVNKYIRGSNHVSAFCKAYICTLVVYTDYYLYLYSNGFIYFYLILVSTLLAYESLDSVRLKKNKKKITFECIEVIYSGFWSEK